MRRRMDQTEYDELTGRIRALGLERTFARMTIDNSYINGITCVEISDSPDGELFTYIEDGLEDDLGYPHLFQYPYHPVYGDIRPGDRMTAIYVDTGYGYYIIPDAVKTNVPFEIDKGRSRKLPTPRILDLPRNMSREITSADREMINSAVKKYGKLTASRIIGNTAWCILCVILFGLAGIFTIGSLDHPGDALIIALLALFAALIIGGSIGGILFFNSVHKRFIRKMKYIRPVMVNDYVYNTIPSGISGISIYEWEGNDARFKSFDVSFASIFIGYDWNYGDIIYMLTREKDSDRQPMAFVSDK